MMIQYRPDLVFVPVPIGTLNVGDHIFDQLIGVRQVAGIRDHVERFYVTFHDDAAGAWYHAGETVNRGYRH